MAKVRKRGKSYFLDYYDQYGNRQRQTLLKGISKKDAEKLLRKIQDEISKGVYIPARQIPVFADVVKEWLEHKKVNIRESTWSVYEGHARNHFRDFDSLKIDRITTKSIEQFIVKRQSDGMNIATLRKILVTLGQIFSLAVRRNYITVNPLDNAERPRKSGNENDTHSIHVLSPEEIKGFLSQIKELKYRTLFNLAIFSGARQGELLGLKWNDVLWDKKQVHIQRTFNNGRFYPPKTITSKRKIDIGPQMIILLKEWCIACPVSDQNLIFQTSAGQPLNHSNLVNRQFLPALKSAGIQRIRFHDLRHTYASLLIEQGENIKYIQTQLGHSNPTVTLNVYAHLMKESNQASAKRLENAINI